MEELYRVISKYLLGEITCRPCHPKGNNYSVTTSLLVQLQQLLGFHLMGATWRQIPRGAKLVHRWTLRRRNKLRIPLLGQAKNLPQFVGEMSHRFWAHALANYLSWSIKKHSYFILTKRLSLTISTPGRYLLLLLIFQTALPLKIEGKRFGLEYYVAVLRWQTRRKWIKLWCGCTHLIFILVRWQVLLPFLLVSDNDWTKGSWDTWAYSFVIKSK